MKRKRIKLRELHHRQPTSMPSTPELPAAPSVADAACVMELHDMLPQLCAADVVLAVMPDGQKIVAKGRMLLRHIKASNAARSLTAMEVAVTSFEVAEALRINLEENHGGQANA